MKSAASPSLTAVLKFVPLAAMALLSLASPTFAAQALRSGMEPIEETLEPAACYDPAVYARVAVVQWNREESTPIGVPFLVSEVFKLETRRQITLYIREAAERGAKLVVTPEFGLVGYPNIPELPPEEMDYRNPDDIRPYVEPIPGPTTQYFGALAKELGIYLTIGMAEVDPADGQFYNAAVAFGPDGAIVAKYHKINLFGLEHRFLSAGEGISTFATPFGRIGMIVCADVYSANPMDLYAREGLTALALSTSWASMNTGMESFRQGALRTRTHVLAANQTYFPDSGVINPDGTYQSHIRQTTGIAYGYLPYLPAVSGATDRR